MLDQEVDECENGGQEANRGREIDARRSRLGLTSLTAAARAAITAAIARRTPAGIRFETLLTIGEEIDAAVPADDFAAWAAACQRLESIAYALRLIEAQLAAGNSGPGMLLPDKDLLV
jgi:hypothetical protein